VILLVNHKAAKLNHNIEFRLNRDLPKISADPGSLRQLFMNIIINSLYFTPEAEVSSLPHTPAFLLLITWATLRK